MTKIKIILFICLVLCYFSTKAVAQQEEDTIKGKSFSTIVVTGTRQETDLRYIPLTVNILSKESLNEKHQTSLLSTLMEQVPGLFVTSRGMLGYGLSGGGSGNINLRGLSGSEGRMMVLIDGHPQYSGIYNHTIADSYQTMMAERVEVLRGPASTIYGSNAMGGVINIVTHSKPDDGTQTNINLGAGSYGTFQSSISNSLKIKSFTSNVAFQFNRSDNHRPNMGINQYSGHINLGYEFNDKWRTFADADLTHFNASNPGSTNNPMSEAEQWITRGAINLGIENHYNHTSGAITAYSNFGRNKINDGYGPAYHKNIPQTEFFRSKDALSGLSIYQTINVLKGNRITAGADYMHIYGNAYYTNRKTGEIVSAIGASGDNRALQSAKNHINEVAEYINLHQDILTWLSIEAGIRFNHHSVAGNEWVPQGGLVFRPLSSAELKTIVGKGFRNPTLKEMYMYGSANDNLDAERIMNYELSWQHRITNCNLNYGINFYYINGDNLIQTVEKKNINTGEIENYGAEAEISWRINENWLLNTNHSLLHMENPIVAAPKYKAYFGTKFSKNRWNASLGIQQINGLYTIVGDEPEQENFTLLNASINFCATKCLKIWLNGENLLAQKYEINSGFPMPRATFMSGINLTF